MEIGKVYQAPEQMVTSAQSVSNQKAGDKTKVADTIPKDFQVNLQDSFNIKLAEFTNILQNREQLIQSLPEDVKKAVVALLRQMTVDTELPQGLENLFKGQKNASEQLKDMSNILNFSAVVNKDKHSEIKAFLQKSSENFMQQAEINPEQAAKELVQLAKQLPVSNAGVQGSLSQAQAQLQEQVVPENMQQLNQNDQKSLLKLTNLLGQDETVQLQLLGKQFANTNTTVEQLKNLIQQFKNQMFMGDPTLLNKEQLVLDQITKLIEPNIPQVLQEGIVKSQLPELPKMWAMLKALGAEQWQNIESKNLEKSAGVVKELAQSIYKSIGLAGEKQAEHSTLSFSVPLQVAEGIYYAAHIHIYHEKKESSSPLPQREFETWLRVGVDTENIGKVDSIFRLYGDNKLDVRVNLPSVSAANQFTQNLPEVRKSLENSKIKLTDVSVSKV